MASKTTKPPAAADAGRLRNTITASAIGSKIISPSSEIQHHRDVRLARRFGLSAAMASAVGGLHFSEARA